MKKKRKKNKVKKLLCEGCNDNNANSFTKIAGQMANAPDESINAYFVMQIMNLQLTSM